MKTLFFCFLKPQQYVLWVFICLNFLLLGFGAPLLAAPIQQGPGADGLVSIEVEDFDANVSQGGHSWTDSFPTGYSGVGALEASPNIGTNVNTGYALNSPRLDYVVNFVKTGVHSVWIRGSGPASTDDSLHVGLDGVELTSSNRVSNFGAALSWTNTRMGGTVATINVTTAGQHTLNIWMREDGTVIDKVVLTTSSGYTPAGAGPPASPRSDLAPAAQPAATPAGGTYTDSVSVSLSTSSPGGQIYYTIDGSDPNAGSTVYAGTPLLFTGDTTLKTITIASSFLDSVVTTEVYTLVPSGGGTPPIQQGLGADGLVSIEVEDFDANVSQGGHSWTDSFPTGYSGAGALEASPNIGTNVNTGYALNSPRLDYVVNFVKTGVHSVWIRGSGPASTDDSLHVGLDGVELTSSNRISNFGAALSWTNTRMGGTVATINVTTAGQHTLNIWMREDGTVIDKVVLTTSSGYTPAGAGPPASPRSDLAPAAQPAATPAAGTYTDSVSVSLSTSSPGGQIYYTIDGSDPNAGSTVYAGTPLLFTGDTTLKTITIASGFLDSVVTTEVYTLVPSGGGTAPIQQGPGADGLVSIEVEDFDANVSQGGHSWTDSFPTGYSGTGALQASPNIGSNVNTGYALNSPRLDYVVNFVKTGVHSVWIRGSGPASTDDSLHVGLDGVELTSSNRISNFGAALSWTNTRMGGTVATINVTTAGQHTLNIWMREDGTVIDKVVLTTSSGYTPAGAGPPASPRSDLAPAAQPAATPAAGTYTDSVSVSLSTATPGGQIYYTIDGSDPNAGSTLYAGTPLVFTGDTTLKTIAIASGFLDSAIASESYQLIPGATFNESLYSFPGASTSTTSMAEAIDGISGDTNNGWAASGAGDYLQLNFTAPTPVARLVLSDLVSASDNIMDATVSFSNGDSFSTGALPTDGAPIEFNFTEIIIDWVRVTIDSAEGVNAGLSEIETTHVLDSRLIEAQEQFNDGDANGWLVTDNASKNAPSNWNVVSNEYVENSIILDQAPEGYEIGSYSRWVGINHGDMDLRFRFKSDGIGVVGLMFGYQGDADYYRLSFSKREGYRKLEKKVAGVFSELATSPQSYRPGDWNNVRVVTKNGVIIVFMNGVQVLSAADNSFTNGELAFWTSRNISVNFDKLILLSAPISPIVAVSKPGDYFVERDLTLDVTAIVTQGVDAVEFVADEGTASEQSTLPVSSSPYTAQFTFSSSGEHNIRAYLLEDSGSSSFTRMSHAGSLHELVQVGAGGHNLVAMGDSITDGEDDDISADDTSLDTRNTSGGFETVLNDNLSTALSPRPITVIDEGNPGDRAWQGADKITAILARNPEAEALLVMYGSNDSSTSLPEDPDLFKGYLQTIASAAIAAGKQVYIAKPPPKIGSTARNTNIEAFNSRIDDLVAEFNLSNPGMVHAGPNFYAYFTSNPGGIGSDNIHPTGAGYQAMGLEWSTVLSADLL